MVACADKTLVFVRAATSALVVIVVSLPCTKIALRYSSSMCCSISFCVYFQYSKGFALCRGISPFPIFLWLASILKQAALKGHNIPARGNTLRVIATF